LVLRAYFRLGVVALGFLFASFWAPVVEAQDASSNAADQDGPQVVKMTTSDGVTLVGDLFRPEATHDQQRGGILFLHEPNRSRRDWAYMAQKMARKGFTSLSVDLRGHGQSLVKGAEELDREIFMDEDYASMSEDLRAAVDFLRTQPGVTERGVQLVGSDLGGSLALMHGVADVGVTSLALLSPGLGYDGLNTMGAAGRFGDRPLMMVFSVEDQYSKKSTEVLAKERSGPTHVEILYGVGHGTKMLSRDPDLEVLVMRWLLGRIFGEDGRAPGEVYKPGSVEKSSPTYDVDAEKRRREEASRDSQSGAVKAVDSDGDGEDRKSWDEEE
jgi:pimeloyl-ACP methyl ester carboxylesterase